MFWQQAQDPKNGIAPEMVPALAVQKFNSVHKDIQLPIPPVGNATAAPNPAAAAQTGAPNPVGASMFEPVRK